jgi:hypothetical protein
MAAWPRSNDRSGRAARRWQHGHFQYLGEDGALLPHREQHFAFTLVEPPALGGATEPYWGE